MAPPPLSAVCLSDWHAWSCVWCTGLQLSSLDEGFFFGCSYLVHQSAMPVSRKVNDQVETRLAPLTFPQELQVSKQHCLPWPAYQPSFMVAAASPPPPR